MIPIARFRSLALAVLACAVVLLAEQSVACIVCVADPLESVLVTELEGSEDVVVAKPSGEGESFVITRVLKSSGALGKGDRVSAQLPAFSEDRGKVGLGEVLLTRNRESTSWIIRAPADAYHLSFFEAVLALPEANSGDVLDDLNRSTFFVERLGHEDRIIARACASEVARLPYAALRKVRSRLDLDQVRAHLRLPGQPTYRALYFTLLGMCGTEEDQIRLSELSDTMWQNRQWKNVGAVLTARMELEGEAVVDEIEARYFRDRNRSLAEIEQAILALRVHGEADQAVSRKRVIEAFRSLLGDREPLVSLIVPDLIRWKDWDSREDLIDLANRRGDDFPELHRHVDAYLRFHPEQELPEEPSE